MAEANSSDFDDSKQSELSEDFNQAAEHVKRVLVGYLETEQLLSLYALYKQSTEGHCPKERPRWYELKAKQKWEAWNNLGEMDQSEAMAQYVQMVSMIDPNWKSDSYQDKPSEGWVTISCLTNSDDFLHDSDKTVFDWVKEGEVQRVRNSVLKEGVNVNVVDSEGMSLIHWAADRGNVEMLKMLIAELNAAINMQDQEGQTALHYAASCGHGLVVEYLLEQKANQSIADVYGMLPVHVACDEDICALFDAIS